MICNCPRKPALTAITVALCLESLGQIQKFAIQRLQKDDLSMNGFVGSEQNPALKASWSPLLAAADSTKIIVTPYVNAPTAEAGAMRTFGGGNETLGGMEENIGREPTPFTSVLRRQPQTVISQLKELQCEIIGVYPLAENGGIAALQYGTTAAPIWRPIPIHSLFVGDKTLGGLEAPDSNAFNFSLPPNWSDRLVIIQPTDFNPLTDLISPVGGGA